MVIYNDWENHKYILREITYPYDAYDAIIITETDTGADACFTYITQSMHNVHIYTSLEK